MKKQIFSITILFFSYLQVHSAISNTAYSCMTYNDCNKKDFIKTIDKTFNVSKEDKVMLNNRYGKVDVKIGNSNTVEINVKITVKAKNENEAKETFEKISILISDEANIVKAETQINNKSSWNGWFENNNSDFQIDYTVTMPADNNLDLKNKYGNSYIASMNGIVTVDQKYGNIKMERMNGPVGLGIAYGDAEIDKTVDMNVVLSYGKLNLNTGRNLNLKTKYSEVNLGIINNVTLTSAYDEVSISKVNNLRLDADYGGLKAGQINNLTLKTDYTDVNIGRLGLAADIEMTYGDLDIAALSSAFSSINIRANYTDVKIKPDLNTSYILDATGSYSDIAQPTGLRTSIDKERGNTWEMVGTVGNTSTKSVIKVKLTYGDLVLK
jgi:hypothetical protein